MISRFNNYNLTHHNTFGLPASCDFFVEYDSVQDLQAFLRENPDFAQTPHFHIGGGSNLVFTDHYRGTILHSAIKGKEVNESAGDVLIKVGAGEDWDGFVEWCVEHGYYGLENLSFIPGEVGASAVQNIGAYGVEAGDFIVEVEAVCLSTGEIQTFDVQACKYAYRHSVFKAELSGKYAVTHVVFRLSKVFEPNYTYGALKATMAAMGIDAPTAQQLRAVVIEIRNAKLPHPSVLGSAGSFFMNPVVDEAMFLDIQKAYPQIPHYAAPQGVKIPAGWLIEQCGWKGKRVGYVGVYDKQALVLVNYGGASGKDVKDLSLRIVADVKEKFGIELRPEANFI